MSMLSLAGTYTISQALIMPSLMDGRDLVSVNKVSDALYERGDKKKKKDTHRSFHGFEPGICKTAVLGQDCTGSA